MTIPPAEREEIDVPLRLQPVVARPQGWQGRSAGLAGAGLLIFLVVAVALGTVFDDGRPAVPVALASASPATGRPSPGPTASRQPLATPLPTREVLGAIPNERRLVWGNGFALLNLSTGSLTPWNGAVDYPVALLPDDEILCACVVRDVTAGGDNSGASLVYRRLDLTGLPMVERKLQSFAGAVPVTDMTEGFNVTIAADPEGRTLFVLVVERRPPTWTAVVHLVDIETGEIRRTLELAQIPTDLEAPTPTASAGPAANTHDGVYVWANAVAVAPGGELAYVSLNRSEVHNDNWTDQMLEWVISGEDVRPLDPGTTLKPGAWCQTSPAFFDAGLLVQVCVEPDANLGSMFLRRLRPDGTAVDDVPIRAPGIDGSWPISVVLDRAHRAAYVWHLQHHALVRVDVDDGSTRAFQVSPAMLPKPPSGGNRQRWFGGDPGLAISPDGSRAYAIGLATSGSGDGGAGIPSGVWVFDATNVELVDQWEPRAFLSSIAVSRDGRFVYAAGAPGVDVNGRDNPWPGSVTVYDAATGEIQVVYGDVMTDPYGYGGFNFYSQP